MHEPEMKRIIKQALVVLTALSLVLSAVYFFWLSPWYTVPILTYHRFGYEKDTLFVTPDNFSKQMDYLKSKRYSVISLSELAEGIKNNKKFPHNTVVITIDDGYKDNFIYAYPILKKHNFPATIFIISSHVENKKDFMNWQDVKIMLRDNILIGAHTKNHAFLPSIKEKNALWDEIKGCKNDIENMTGSRIDHFCYPLGFFNDEVKKLVEEAGYMSACTTNRGRYRSNKDVYELNRVKVTNSDTNKSFHFSAKLSGYYNLFRSLKTDSE
ncbi:MAG: polysaccharide deacetylase family protein [Candidatus Omnitrophota bacterium]